MVNIKTWITALSLVVIGVLIIALKPGNTKEINEEYTVADGESFAVVELFTSEGCSSCPPADKLLGDIVEKARNSNQRIFALSFHVDYWDRLGWKDPFSSAEYSQRQRSYARALRSNVYTPQMVINGKVEFVGSNSSRARTGIENSLAEPAAASVALSNVKAGSGQIELSYEVSGNYESNVLNVAVVERNITTEVKRGENGGRTLRHENVVRTFRSFNLGNASGEATLDLPGNIDMNNASVIAYMQNPDSKEIYGAQKKDLGAKLSQAK